MYDRILVPLDGSEIAERVLPYVEALAAPFNSTVILLEATTPPEAIIAAGSPGNEPVAGPVVDPMPIVEAEREEAGAYLAGMVERLRGRGLRAEYERSEGHPPELIARRAGELGVDLIAMTTHGRGGVGRLVFGSVADEVLRTAPCPVLLVRARDGGASSSEAKGGAMLRMLLAGATGAAIAYFLDPDRGRRRRNLARDRAAASLRRGLRQLERARRATGAEAYGMTQKVVHGLGPRDEPPPSDAALAHKVESKLFSDPDIPKGQINVNVEHGVVVLRGELGHPEQIEAVERAAREVAGVLGVESYLHLPGTPAPNKREARVAR